MACSLMGVEGGVAAILDAGGVDVNAQDELGMSALIAASVKGHTGIVAVLLQAGANPNLARKASAAQSGHKTPKATSLSWAPCSCLCSLARACGCVPVSPPPHDRFGSLLQTAARAVQWAEIHLVQWPRALVFPEPHGMLYLQPACAGSACPYDCWRRHAPPLYAA